MPHPVTLLNIWNEPTRYWVVAHPKGGEALFSRHVDALIYWESHYGKKG